MLVAFATSFPFQFLVSRYITRLNRTSVLKGIVVCIFYELPFSITSVSIYYGIHSKIRVKSYCRSILLRASVQNFKRLDILRDTIGHPSKKLLSLEFAQNFCFQFRASRYITWKKWTSELKVIMVWICFELPLSITSVSI